MKKIIFTLAFMLCCVVALHAQKIKGKPNRADSYLSRGDIEVAKAEIDKAIEDDKYAERGRTWYTRGQVYKAIYNDTTGLFSDSLKNKALDVAAKSYKKAMDMEKESSTYYVFAQQAISSLWSNAINYGATAYQEGNYKKAVKLFEDAAILKPKDTTAYVYGGSAAMQAEMPDKSLDFYYKLIDLGSAKPDIYNMVIYLEKTQKQNKEKALEVVKQAKEQYPNNKSLMQEEISLLITLDKLDDAVGSIKTSLKENPEGENNHILWYDLGYIYDSKEMYDSAVYFYKKALEVKEDYFDAVFNIGVNLFNRGAEIYNKANKLSLKEYEKKGKEIEAEAKEYFRDAIPYFEQAIEMQPDNVTVIETLQKTYAKLQMKEKVNKMEQKLKELGAVSDEE